MDPQILTELYFRGLLEAITCSEERSGGGATGGDRRARDFDSPWQILISRGGRVAAGAISG